MRKLAWLNAIPEGSKDRKTRREVLEAGSGKDSAFLRLPELDGAEYIIHMLYEAGTLTLGGMSAAPLSWQEIEAWCRVTEYETSVWERMLVKELSHAYVNELHAATEKNRPDPYIYVPEGEVDREAVDKKARSIFKNLKRSA